MPARVSSADERIRERAVARRDEFVALGVNISEWARERGFNVSAVHNVLGGHRSCRRGASHQIAVALGIKDDPRVSALKLTAPIDLEPAQ